MKTKLISLLLLVTLVCSLFAGCSSGGDGGSDGTSVLLEDFKKDFYYPPYPMYSISVFKVVFVYDEIYNDRNTIKYLIAECEIQKCYDGPARVGDRVNISVPITTKNPNTYYDELSEEERALGVRNFLLEQDSFFGVFSLSDYFTHYSAEKGFFESDLYTCPDHHYFLDTGYYLPINEGKLDFKPLTHYVKRFVDPSYDISIFTYKGYEDYFRDGMTEQELDVTANKIKEDLINKRSGRY